MELTAPLRHVIASLLVIALLAGCGAVAISTAEDNPTAGDSPMIAEGRRLYESTCAACHGADLTGADNGPPFLDPIYAPDHHADGAFFIAAAMGVQAHHWDFGPMPRQPVEPDEVRKIVAYVRSVQRAEGIAP